MELEIKLQVFEGPLDLLLHLIDKNKVNIYDIPIVEITDQYMEYIYALKQQDLNIVSEFLVMAATLLDIKSRMLLPKETDDEGQAEDPRQELVEKLLEYKMYKYMSYELRDRQLYAGKSMYKRPTIPEEVKKYETPVDLELLLKDITLSKLNRIFQDVMKRQADKIDPVRSKFGKIEREEVNLEEKKEYVLMCAREYGTCSFRQILKEQNSKPHIIATFLAILELMKVGKIEIEQHQTFDDIIIHECAESNRMIPDMEETDGTNGTAD